MLGCKPPPPSLSVQEQLIVNELTQDLQTHCVGRFLIDLPKGASVRTIQSVGHNREVVIEAMNPMSHDTFNTRMAQIETEYRSKRHYEEWPYLYSVGSPSSAIRLFERLESEHTLSDSSRAIEGYKWSDNKVIKLVTMARDVSDEKYRNDSLAQQVGTNTPKKKALVADLLKRVRGRDMKEVPTEPGVCFEGGFLASKAEADEEIDATIEFGRAMPDVSIRFSANSYIQEAESLLGRKSTGKAVSDNNWSILRKGVIKVPGALLVEELLMAGDMEQSNNTSIKGHYFKLEGNSKVGSPQTPFFDLVMRNGGAVEPTFDENGKFKPTTASLTEAKAVALWDAVSKTIRMRPGAL